MVIEVLPLSGALGAEVRGIKVAAMNEESFQTVNQILLDHAVIYMRDQQITPDQQLTFARRWNEVHLHPYLRGLREYPEIMEIVREPNDTIGFGDHWHTDQIFTPTPAMATMLYAKVVPPVGGDTLFASTTRAYDALSDGMKRMLAGLRTVNQYDKAAPRSANMQGKIPDKNKPTDTATHPLVRVHPETGRSSLYLTDIQTTRRFEGMTEEESQPLITFLLRHTTRPDFTCRLSWQPGTLGIWDNRCTLHMALNDYAGHRRVMHRITIKGTAPVSLYEMDAAAE